MHMLSWSAKGSVTVIRVPGRLVVVAFLIGQGGSDGLGTGSGTRGSVAFHRARGSSDCLTLLTLCWVFNTVCGKDLPNPGGYRKG